MNLQEIISNDLDIIIGELGHTFIYNSHTYPCVASSNRRAINNDLFGIESPSSLTLLVNKSKLQLSDNDEILQKIITYKNKDYRVIDIELDPNDISIRLICGDPNARN